MDFNDLEELDEGDFPKVSFLPEIDNTGIREEYDSLGGCFNKHDGLSDRATDHLPMLFVHSRMVRHHVAQSVVFIETAS